MDGEPQTIPLKDPGAMEQDELPPLARGTRFLVVLAFVLIVSGVGISASSSAEGNHPQVAGASVAAFVESVELAVATPTEVVEPPSHEEPGVVPSSPDDNAASSTETTRPVTAASSVPRPFEYTIVPGDYLGKLAERFACSVDDLRRANGLRSDRIRAGNVLTIPRCPVLGFAEVATAPEVEDGSSLDTVAASAELPPRRISAPVRDAVDNATLPSLMAARGFKPPENFRAYVIEVSFSPERRQVERERVFDWKGRSSEVYGWNAASTVKVFAAMAAVHRIEALGFTTACRVTFHGRRTRSATVAKLLDKALIDSDNVAYNRLVQLAGYDYLNEEFFTQENGFSRTALNGAYGTEAWTRLKQSMSLRHSPRMTLVEGDLTLEIPRETGDTKGACKGSACTSLRDLAEAMRQLMLQEQLPESKGSRLSDDGLEQIRHALGAEKARGRNVVDALSTVFDDDRVRFYHKPGFSKGWFTDVVYIYDPSVNQSWIIALTSSGGRKSLDRASTVLAEVIVSGELGEATSEL